MKTVTASKAIFLAAICRSFGGAQLQEVLAKVGLEKADIDAINGLPEDAKDFAPDTYIGKINSTYENRFLNDATFLSKLQIDKLPESLTKSIQAGQYGRFMNEYKSLVGKLGIDLTDLSDEDSKSLNKLANASFEKFKGKLGTPEAVTKLQNDLQAALTKATDFETSIPTIKADVEKAVTTKMGETIVSLIAENTLNSLATDFELKVDSGLVIDSLMGKLKSKYNIVQKGKELELMQLANPELKVIGSDGKALTFKDALLAEAQAGKVIGDKKKVEDNNDTQKGKTKIVVDGNETSVIGASVKALIEENQKKEPKVN